MAKEKSDLTKHTLFLYRGDYERVRQLAGDNRAAILIRKLIRKWLVDADKVHSRPSKALEKVDVKI